MGKGATFALMVKKKPLQDSDKVAVTFETAPRPDAQSVGLAADFNGWDPAAAPMKQRKDGCWWATLRLTKDQEYAYRFVVDGREWITDEQADRMVPNEHGETNAIVDLRNGGPASAAKAGSARAKAGTTAAKASSIASKVGSTTAKAGK